MHKIIYDSIVTTCSANSPKHANKKQQTYRIPCARRTLLKIRKRTNGKINLARYLKKPGYESRIEKLEKKKASLEIQIRDSIRAEAVKRELDVIEKIKTNPRAFFTYAKRKSKTHTNIGPLVDENNKLHCDSATMSNLLQAQYKHRPLVIQIVEQQTNHTRTQRTFQN